jgi:uncharacterized OsmC-like protein
MMTAEELRERQAPLKDRYRSEPASALATLKAHGQLDVSNIVCRVVAERGSLVDAGLHPMAAGDGTAACAGNMLLEALVGCAGVTLSAVATAMGIPVHGGAVTAEGDMDFRGTLGVNRDVPVGFSAIRVSVVLETPADDAQLKKLGELTERYCVVAQSLKGPIAVKVSKLAGTA